MLLLTADSERADGTIHVVRWQSAAVLDRPAVNSWAMMICSTGLAARPHGLGIAVHLRRSRCVRLRIASAATSARPGPAAFGRGVQVESTGRIPAVVAFATTRQATSRGQSTRRHQRPAVVDVRVMLRRKPMPPRVERSPRLRGAGAVAPRCRGAATAAANSGCRSQIRLGRSGVAPRPNTAAVARSVSARSSRRTCA